MKKEHVTNFQGNEFVKYEGLLDEAHQQGLCRISTLLIQVPDEANGHTAIVSAEVETSKGTFGGLGDASPNNVGRNIAPHIIRMAETRAKARAMRDAVNIGMTSLEELGDFSEEKAASRSTETNRPAASPDKPASANQLATIQKLSRLLGATEPDDLEHWTSAQASDRITELSRRYNEVKGNALTKRSA